ncbi:MAG: type II toxin-antitoxin system RelE/ParE family toxin [Elusimicrobia bacterium]|nr:type II toxin-antitoxin system RelE/ParE family toxin [Elusimicrobiota bacterium]
MKKYRIEFLPSAWREIDEISSYYLNKVGPKSAKRVFDRILKAIERLEIFPLSCPLINDEVLSREGYRILICDDYICVYRLIDEVVYIYHIANGKTNYKSLM